MTQLGGRQTAATIAAIGLWAFAGPAHAARAQIDGPSNSIPLCTYGGPACSATLLQSTGAGLPGPFSFNFGFGTYDRLFIYSNGLVSIGNPIAAGADFSSLSSLGGVGKYLFTPGYAPGRIFSLATIQGPDTTQIPDPNAGRPVVRVSLCFATTTCNSDDRTEQFSIYDLGAGKYELKFNYGAFLGTNPPVFPDNAYAGYSFNGTTVEQSGAGLQRNVIALAPFEYFFPAAVPSVPEPATWAMLVAGFMGVGAALRRATSRRGFVPAT